MTIADRTPATGGTRVALLANHRPGLEAARIILAAGDTLARLYVAGAESAANRETIDRFGPLAGMVQVVDGKPAATAVDAADWDVDFIVTAYWPYLLPPWMLRRARRGTVNFHPALLPVNRGWFPHVHSLVDGSPSGVTLHAIDDGVDTGPIWVQREVPASPTDTAKSLYDRLQAAIIDMFADHWTDIRDGVLTPVPQDHARAIHHRKSEVGALDRIDPDRAYTGRELVNLLRARSFGSRGFAYLEEADGRRVYLNLRLSDSPDFPGDGG